MGVPSPPHSHTASDHLIVRTELSRFEGSYKPSEFLGHVGTETCHCSETLSYAHCTMPNILSLEFPPTSTKPSSGFAVSPQLVHLTKFILEIVDSNGSVTLCQSVTNNHIFTLEERPSYVVCKSASHQRARNLHLKALSTRDKRGRMDETFAQ